MADYTFRLSCGIGLSLIWLWFAAPVYIIERKTVMKLSWILALSALSTGRIGYALMHIDYFRQNPLQVIQMHRVGGIHGESALLGGITGLALWSAVKYKKSPVDDNAHNYPRIHSFRRLLALNSPAALCVAAGAWWACMRTGCAWGREAVLTEMQFGWHLIEGPDLYLNMLPRYPVQLVGLVLSLAGVIWGITRPQQISRSLSAFGLYCAGASALTLLRGDDVINIGAIRVDTLINIIVTFLLAGVRYWRG